MDNSDSHSSLKRKRTTDLENNNLSPVISKTAKTHNHLAINYLARQNPDDLPLISHDDSLHNILLLLTDYHGVLDRHESMAYNLGAQPLGPILVKRFERLFDGPPRVLKSHGKEGTTVSWLDVVEFARSKPEQFKLEVMSEGVRVCQFYTKQCRVQISQEDHVLICSGMPQRLIPPQPVLEDEEKELGTLEILEANLHAIYQMADQGMLMFVVPKTYGKLLMYSKVAARGRQLRHRILARKQAIIDRRVNDSSFEPQPEHAFTDDLVNGDVAHDTNGHAGASNKAGATDATIQELLKQFSSVRVLRKLAIGEADTQGQNAFTSTIANAVRALSNTPGARDESISDSLGQVMHATTNMFAVPGSAKIDESPFKAEMIGRMEAVKRGDRIMPPCDRCRRLHMDCIKNLTACQGCTKKHAKCGWKEVRLEELNYSSTMSDHNHHDMYRNGEVENRHHSNMFANDNIDLEAVAKASSAALDATEAENMPYVNEDLEPHPHPSPNATYQDTDLDEMRHEQQDVGGNVLSNVSDALKETNVQ